MDELAHHLLQNDMTMEEFLEDFNPEIIELLETSSVVVKVFGKKFLLSLNVEELK